MAIKVEHRIGVAAPVDDIYELLEDINAWPEWSPIHKAARGELHFGYPIHLEEHYEGLGTWEIDGIIDDWSPLSHIHVNVPKPFYAGKLVRYFEMDALSDQGSTFTIGALFSGYLSEREAKQYRPFLRKGFEAFAEAVKAKAEARFAAGHNSRRTHMPIKEPPTKPQLGPDRPVWNKSQFMFFPKKKK